jgi:hypothetical protein
MKWWSNGPLSWIPFHRDAARGHKVLRNPKESHSKRYAMVPPMPGSKFQLHLFSEFKLTAVFYLGLISICFFGLDYVTGPAIQEPYFYVLLVISAVWLFGSKTGFVLAVGLPLFRILAIAFWKFPWPLSVTVVNVLIQIATLVIVVYLTKRISELVLEVRTLKGRLPICVHCKRIRNLHNEWEHVETYVSRQSELKFIHGICPDCSQKHSEELSAVPQT